VTERAEVEISSQPGVSTQLEVPLAQEERVEVKQPGSPTVLMPTSLVAEPSPTTELLSGKAPANEASFVQVSSSSSEEQVDFSGDEYDFGDQLAPPGTSKYSHISEEEMQVDVPAMAPPLGEVATTEGIFSIPLNHYSIDLDKHYFNASFEFYLQELLPVPML